MNTIQAQWVDFRKLVIPTSAPDIQVSEMQRAFYAGAEIFETLKNECEAFGLSGGN